MQLKLQQMEEGKEFFLVVYLSLEIPGGGVARNGQGLAFSFSHCGIWHNNSSVQFDFSVWLWVIFARFDQNNNSSALNILLEFDFSPCNFGEISAYHLPPLPLCLHC